MTFEPAIFPAAESSPLCWSFTFVEGQLLLGEGDEGLAPGPLIDAGVRHYLGRLGGLDAWAQRVEAVPPGWRRVPLRAAMMALPAAQMDVAARAAQVIEWDRTHRFCGVCGTATKITRGGHVRMCTNESCKTEHFPRTDPAVIMLVHHGDKCLLGRGKHFPRGMHSTLAGFVEPGESFEDAVAREVYEEVKVRVSNVIYRSSQPWPFPASVMIGFLAAAESMDFSVNESELESARWLSREELRPENMPKDGSFFMPRRDSIARRLIEEWLGHEAGASITG